jgi:hypothetical protein
MELFFCVISAFSSEFVDAQNRRWSDNPSTPARLSPSFGFAVGCRSASGYPCCSPSTHPTVNGVWVG